MKRRQAILMLGGLSSGSLLLGSGAFSSARAERTVNVSVAEDDEALVGYSSEDRTVPMDLTDDDRVPLVTVTNQFAESVSVTAEIVEGAEYVGDVDDLKIPSGKSETVTGDINLESGEAVLEPGERIDISVSLDVDGTGVSDPHKTEIFGRGNQDSKVKALALVFMSSRRSSTATVELSGLKTTTQKVLCSLSSCKSTDNIPSYITASNTYINKNEYRITDFDYCGQEWRDDRSWWDDDDTGYHPRCRGLV